MFALRLHGRRMAKLHAQLLPSPVPSAALFFCAASSPWRTTKIFRYACDKKCTTKGLYRRAVPRKTRQSICCALAAHDLCCHACGQGWRYMPYLLLVKLLIALSQVNIWSAAASVARKEHTSYMVAVVGPCSGAVLRGTISDYSLRRPKIQIFFVLRVDQRYGTNLIHKLAV
jgi:hypothetical protein